MEDVLTGLTGIAFFGLLVTKLIDTVRNALDPDTKWPKVAWNLIAFGIGIGIAVIWQINLVDGEAVNGVRGVAGQVITGMLFGAGSGAWHEFLDRKQLK